MDNCSSSRPSTKVTSAALLQSAICVTRSPLGTSWGSARARLPRAWLDETRLSENERGPQKNADLLLTETKSSPNLPPPT